MGHGTLLAEKPVGAHGSLTASSTIAATRAGPVDNAVRIRHAEQPPERGQANRNRPRRQ
jgi:hypothetical protein